MIEKSPLCFLDTETTGLMPDRKVWEVGMIRRDYKPGGDYVEHEIQFFVDVDLGEADLFGLNVGRFYERHPMGRYLAGDESVEIKSREDRSRLYTDYDDGTRVFGRDLAARTVARMTHGTHLVGAVPNFDDGCLAPMLREFGLTPMWHYHLVDVEALAAGWLAAHGTHVRPPWATRELYRGLGIEEQPDEDKHTALGDARYCRRVYDRVMEGTF